MDPARIFLSFLRRTLPRLLCLALMLVPTAPHAFAAHEYGTGLSVDPVSSRDNYTAVLYNNTNGLPTSEANDIVQTEEGFIWIGSYSGLIRYDGNTFERMDSTQGVASVVCLHVDRQGRLWIGTNENGVAMLDNGELRLFGWKGILGAAKVTDIDEDDSGLVYVATANGLSTVTSSLEFARVECPELNGAYIESLRSAKGGLMYCITNDSRVVVLRGGKSVKVVDSRSTNIEGITCVLPDPLSPEDLFVGTKDSALFYGDLQHDPDELVCYDISPLSSVLDIARFGDQIWLPARNGIGVIDGDGFHHLYDLPMDNSVIRVMSDYEGNLWFASTRQGVMKLVSNPFTDVFKRYGIPQYVVNSTCVYHGTLYVGTDTGLLALNDDGAVGSIPIDRAVTALHRIKLEETDLLEMLNGCRIRSIIRDSRDRLWISTWMSRGLLCFDGSTLTQYTDIDGLLSDHIRAVCEAPDGAIYVAHTGGVSVIRDGLVTESYGPQEGIANVEILTVASSPYGDIVAGSNGGGIYVVQEGKVLCVDSDDGLSSDIVMRVKYDPDRDVFWIVTSNSLAYMTREYRVTTVEGFPFSNNFDLYSNSEGDMWILSSNGIYVVPAEDLLAGGEIKPVHYGMGNGLPCIATSNSYSCLTGEGDLFIAGTSSVVRVNVDIPMEDIFNLKQAVPYIEVDGILYYPDEDGGFTIPKGARKVTVYAHVFNYSLTDPTVSLMLEGFDRESVTVARRDLAPVTYTNLPGGSYTFVMELKDSLGRGSQTLVVHIEKEKALYEQTWFYILSCAAGLAVILAGIRLYVRKKTRELEARHREAMEKERLTSELTTAARIQASMLPDTFPPFPDRTEFDLYASMDPAREVGGDFYDFFLIDEDHLCLVIADVSGKGIPASLFMMISKVILQSCAMLGISPGQILTKTNEGICSANRVDMFVTVWLGILEISTGRVVAANAGHEYPALTKDGKFELMKDRHGLVIGGMEGVRYKEYEFTLKKGDKLFVYTDGVPEATDAGNRMFGTDRMLDALNGDLTASPEQVLKNVRNAVDDFVQDAEQFDDLTMLCLEYRGPGGGEGSV